jgi:hypothetical protein
LAQVVAVALLALKGLVDLIHQLQQSQQQLAAVVAVPITPDLLVGYQEVLAAVLLLVELLEQVHLDKDLQEEAPQEPIPVSLVAVAAVQVL